MPRRRRPRLAYSSSPNLCRRCRICSPRVDLDADGHQVFDDRPSYRNVSDGCVKIMVLCEHQRHDHGARYGNGDPEDDARLP